MLKELMRTKHQIGCLPRIFRASLLFLLGIYLCIPPLPSGAADNPAGQRPVELILVCEDQPWFLLAAAPLAATLREQGRVPILLTVSSEAHAGHQRLLDRLLPLCNSCTVIAKRRHIDSPGLGFGNTKANFIVARDSPTATLLLARQYWRQTDAVVLGNTAAPELAILAAALAAHRKIPFLAYDTDAELAELAVHLQEMGVVKVTVPAGSPGVDLLRDQCEVVELDADALVDRTVGLIGVKNIRNIILTRAPSPFAGASSWIAPYLSVMRRAPVEVSASEAASEAEAQFTALVDRHDLRPATVTILADYESIGTVPVADAASLGDYEVDVEPCSRPEDNEAAAYGVGRIPFRRLADASLMIAGGLARETIVRENPPHVLMIANPSADYGALPLAELVSRATAEEFKNFGWHVSEHYGKAANSPDIINAAGNSHLIIYEGHISDQYLIQEPYDIYEEFDGNDTWDHSAPEDMSVRMNVYEPSGYADGSEMHDATDYEASLYESDSAVAADQEGFYAHEMESFLPSGSVECLQALPLVILQSCHSLEQPTLDHLLELGGAGMVGSVTSIHSASGSAFVKAFCDGMLYRCDTVGEALRDARNYFLCLAQLKQQRGHQETAKVYRAALTFRFWGDPEMRLFSSVAKPRRRGISAAMTDPTTVRISTPKYRLPESRNERYFARLFPGSQLAGIVKRLTNEPIRRLTPLYFFRLPLPGGSGVQAHRRLERDGEDANRMVYLTDPLGRFIYVLYFPEKEAKSDAFTLQFIE